MSSDVADTNRQYLDDAIDEARRLLPGWAYAVVAKKLEASDPPPPPVVDESMEPVEPVESFGPSNALVAFIGGSPAPDDPEVDSLFKELYLAPIEVDPAQVLMASAISEPLLDDDGRRREPTSDEIDAHREGLFKMLDDHAHAVVVALGRRAKEALGDRADFSLPHPAAVARRGDSGEVGRKVKAIKDAILKSMPDEDGIGEWEDGWHTLLKCSGEFAHAPGDLLLKCGDKWVGWRAKDGGVQKSEGPVNTAFRAVKDNDLGKAHDKGSYQIGMATKDSVEIFLDGRQVKGRYLVKLAKMAGRNVWQMSKPDDQAPHAGQRNLAETMGELKRKGHEVLFWGKPGEKTQRIDVQSGRVEKELCVPIAKADSAKRIVYGAVLDPYIVDDDGDWTPPGAIEDTAHEWMRASRVIGTNHQQKADAYPVESWIVQYPSEDDYRKALAGEAHRAYKMSLGNDVVHSGSWVVGTKLGPKEWAEYQDGELDAYSIGGRGYRTVASPSIMPEVLFVDLTS